MPSRSLLSVQEKLERRWRYVCEAEWMAIGQAMAHYHAFVSANPMLSLALQRACRAYPSEDWLLQATDRRTEAARPLFGSESHVEATARGWMLLSWAVKSDAVLEKPHGKGVFARLLAPLGTGPHAVAANHAAVMRRDFLVNTHLRPLHEYLLDALDSNVETLAAIRWFEHWARWFGASRFEWERRLELEAVEGRRKADPTRTPQAQYEKRFQLVLFEKLFEYGLYLEISREPNTAAGSPDFTVIQRTSSGPRPIVVEAKILDKETDPKAKLGHLQIRRYMDTLRADAGYLVLFDLTERGHHVEIPDRLDDLPFLPTGDGRQVYVIHAPCVSQVSASKADPIALKPVHFQFELD